MPRGGVAVSGQLNEQGSAKLHFAPECVGFGHSRHAIRSLALKTPASRWPVRMNRMVLKEVGHSRSKPRR